MTRSTRRTPGDWSRRVTPQRKKCNQRAKALGGSTSWGKSPAITRPPALRPKKLWGKPKNFWGSGRGTNARSGQDPNVCGFPWPSMRRASALARGTRVASSSNQRRCAARPHPTPYTREEFSCPRAFASNRFKGTSATVASRSRSRSRTTAPPSRSVCR